MKRNAIRVINPYFHAGTWVFDDQTCGLVKEPFVSGIPEIINLFVGGIENPKKGFRLLFSDNQFPGSIIRLDRCEPEAGGYWYQLHGTTKKGWLCPAMFNYFEQAPDSIFAAVEASAGNS